MTQKNDPVNEANLKKDESSSKDAQIKKEDTNKTPEQKLKSFKNPFSLDDPLQDRFVRSIMKNGKKNLARRILKQAFDQMFLKGEKDPLKTFEKAIQNATPSMEVRPKRIGGAVYQIPIEVTIKRQKTLPVRWILTASRSKKGQPIHRSLAAELIDCANEAGGAYGKKVEAHKSAQANKAFAHLGRY